MALASWLIPAAIAGASYLANRSKKKGGSSGSPSSQALGYQYRPYSGARPPTTDTAEAKFLRPTQALNYDIISKGAQGQGIGYDPALKQAAIALVQSQLGRAKEDDIRDAQGRVAASGLSGNLRAQEALTGRVDRDYGRTFGEELGKINIADLERQNLERDVNRGRLDALNRFQFGQENRVADFDLAVYGQEEGNRQSASADELSGYRYNQGIVDKKRGSVTDALLAAGDLYSGMPSGASSSIASLAGRQSGIGISPQYQTPPFYSQPLNYRNRRLLTR